MRRYLVRAKADEEEPAKPVSQATRAVPQPVDSTRYGSYHLAEVRRNKLGAAILPSRKAIPNTVTFSTPTSVNNSYEAGSTT